MPDTLTTKEVCAIAGRCANTLQRWVERGIIDAPTRTTKKFWPCSKEKRGRDWVWPSSVVPQIEAQKKQEGRE